MNPVQAQIRAELDARHRAWRDRVEDPVPTRAGLRYHAAHVAALLGPLLAEVGLRVHEETLRTFVTEAGRQVTHSALGDLLAGALTEHDDAVLASSVTSPAFFEHLSYRLPAYRGDALTRSRSGTSKRRARTAAERGCARRLREERAETASSLAFLSAIARRCAGERVIGKDLYSSAVTNIDRRLGEVISRDDVGSEFWAIPRRRLLFEVASEIFGPGSRRRGSTGVVFVVPADPAEPLDRARRMVDSLSLSPSVAETLRTLGVEDPEAAADEAVAEILVRAPARRPAVLDPRVVALPDEVALAVAGVDEADVVRTFGLMARERLRRHPEDREAIAAVAVALRAGDPDGLVSQIRARAAESAKAATLGRST